MRIEGDNLWPVTSNDTCPTGPPDACCYCGVKVSQQHTPTCVLRERTVVVDVTFRLVRQVPEYWSPKQVKYGMNNSRWCASNVLSELDNLAEHAGCICDFFEGRYVREATAEDEDKFGVRVERKPGQHSDADQD